MRTVDEFFANEPNIVLYHYTSVSGLTGIVESKTLWASHIYSLNDSSEITHARDILKNEINLKCKQSIPENEKEFLQQFYDWLDSFTQTPYHIFIFALSEKGSLLSQWRSYTPHGKGISIGFEPKTLMRKVKEQNFKIAKCLYEPHEQSDLTRALLDKMLITFRRECESLDLSKYHPSQRYFLLLDKFRGDILQVFSTIKHPAFREEQEWRIISPYFPKYTIPKIKFREGASMLVSYVEIDIKNNNNDSILFEKVILGPTSHNNLAMANLSAYLSNKRVCNTTCSSCIPYREW